VTVADGVATITLDDGKVNALSFAMLESINAALDTAENDDAIVVLRGRDGIFSAGFDLKVMSAGGAPMVELLMGGMDLARRMLAFPRPVALAVTGHAVAMGAILLTAADYRLGVDGPFRVQTNEVQIGMTMPHAGLAMLTHRLTGPGATRAVVLAEPLSAQEALRAGFLDQLAQPEEFDEALGAVVDHLGQLDHRAYRATKKRYRADLFEAIDAAKARDLAEVSPTG
jgi:enoyl-CoA hydratase